MTKRKEAAVFGGMVSVVLVIAAIGCVAFFYKAGEMADSDRIGGRKDAVWALASAGLWLVALFLLHWGLWKGLLLQAGLLVFLTVWGAVRSAGGTKMSGPSDRTDGPL